MGAITDWELAGFFNGKVNIELAATRMEQHLDQLVATFQGFSVEQLQHRPAPGKWSKQEILGHLIDSALNNLRRFTEIQYTTPPYRVVSYRQAQLVTVNRYQELPLIHLLELWRSLNQQILFIIKSLDSQTLEAAVITTYEAGEQQTLGWLICDYVAHLEHHLRQVVAEPGQVS